MATVHYNNKQVSDANVREVLQTIANLYEKHVTVTSGDRHQALSVGGKKKSLHLQKRAADFHVVGVLDKVVYRDLKVYASMIFDWTQGYEVIMHGPHTETMGAHLHIGHYPGKRHTGRVLFKTEGLTQKT